MAMRMSKAMVRVVMWLWTDGSTTRNRVGSRGCTGHRDLYQAAQGQSIEVSRRSFIMCANVVWFQICTKEHSRFPLEHANSSELRPIHLRG